MTSIAALIAPVVGTDDGSLANTYRHVDLPVPPPPAPVASFAPTTINHAEMCQIARDIGNANRARTQRAFAGTNGKELARIMSAKPHVGADVG